MPGCDTKKPQHISLDTFNVQYVAVYIPDFRSTSYAQQCVIKRTTYFLVF